MTAYLKMVELDDGWCEWIHPFADYRFSCCDCGLVHDLEFRLDDVNQLNFRARRNIKSTAAIRREAKKRKEIEDGRLEPK